MFSAFVVPALYAKQAKTFLEEKRWLDTSRRVWRHNQDVAFPIVASETIDVAAVEGSK